jgi:hypothetical protein
LWRIKWLHSKISLCFKLFYFSMSSTKYFVLPLSPILNVCHWSTLVCVGFHKVKCFHWIERKVKNLYPHVFWNKLQIFRTSLNWLGFLHYRQKRNNKLSLFLDIFIFKFSNCYPFHMVLFSFMISISRSLFSSFFLTHFLCS